MLRVSNSVHIPSNRTVPGKQVRVYGASLIEKSLENNAFMRRINGRQIMVQWNHYFKGVGTGMASTPKNASYNNINYKA